MKSMKKTGGLRKRWLLNTVGVVFALGLVCVMAVTASYATYYYSNMQSDMENRAKTTTDFFADYINQDYGDYYQSCITYAKTFEDKGKIELQFINNQGSLVASSYGPWAGPSPSTSDIWDAISIRDKSSYIGRDPDTGERIMAVSCPMIYSNGEVIGVLRYVTSTRLVNRQIILVCLVCCFVLTVVLAVVLLFTFAVRVVLVSGPSMRETLQHRDCLLVMNAHLCGGFEAGDIVIIRKESFKDGEPIVKRVIATEGQTVDIDFVSGAVYVDGELLEEDYINEPTYVEEGTEFPLTVPEGSIFVMGDNRNHSSDSRSSDLGTVDTRYVIGRAVFLLFPGADEDTANRDFGRIGPIAGLD